MARPISVARGSLVAGLSLAFLALLLLATRSSARNAELLERAETAETAAASLVRLRDLERERADSLELVSSVNAREHTQDSLAWSATAEVSRAEAALAARAGAEVAAQLRELADATELVLLDSLESFYNEELSAVREELEVSRLEGRSLYDQRTTLSELVQSLRSELALEQQINANLEDAIAAYRELARPGIFSRLSAELVDPSLYVGVAIGAGLAIVSR